MPGCKFDGGRSSVGRVPDCDSGCRGFEPHRPPHHLEFGPLAQLVEQWTLNPLVEGSNPSWPTNIRLIITNSYKIIASFRAGFFWSRNSYGNAVVTAEIPITSRQVPLL